MEFVKKGLTGYKQVNQVDADSVILNMLEYREFQKQKQDLENQMYKLKNELELKGIQADNQLNELRNEFKERLELHGVEVRQAEERAANFENLNRDLLRVAKERANAARGLTPKKEHPGYVVINSSDARLYDTNKNIIAGWRTTIQSPYDVAINAESAKTAIYNDFINGIGKILGIDSMANIGQEVDFKKAPQNKNLSFNYVFHKNVKSGFWEMDFLHFYEIVIPSQLRPQPQQKGR